MIAFMKNDKTMIGFAVSKAGTFWGHDTKSDKDWVGLFDWFEKDNPVEPNPIKPGTLLFFEITKNEKIDRGTYKYTVNISRYDFFNGNFNEYWLSFSNIEWIHNSAYFRFN
jgi:hypothetical protein